MARPQIARESTYKLELTATETKVRKSPLIEDFGTGQGSNENEEGWVCFRDDAKTGGGNAASLNPAITEQPIEPQDSSSDPTASLSCFALDLIHYTQTRVSSQRIHAYAHRRPARVCILGLVAVMISIRDPSTLLPPHPPPNIIRLTPRGIRHRVLFKACTSKNAQASAKGAATRAFTCLQTQISFPFPGCQCSILSMTTPVS